ncbi:MAG TPA: FAD-dependent 5-carboxymethylaminomethyl-2-thiouridine(34) oxidoreductase MnmC [Rubrivivax sp.]|nr:FAD-dependent 5-carboxymethylaminomethyl-2-thiouridine(34) oxidoreductase MnmC [Rubrivivax sp.]
MTPDLAALQALWRQRDQVVLLQAGFGTGEAFLGIWHAWRHDAQRRARLHVITIEPTPPDARGLLRAHRHGVLAALAHELAALWPPRTRNLHRIGLDGGQLTLLLAIGETMAWLPELRAEVDVFRLEAAAMPADVQRAPQRLCKALARLAAAQASVTLALPPRAIRPALRSAGFQCVDEPPGSPASAAAEGATLTRAVYRPQFVPRRRAPRYVAANKGQVLIVGAGLAGCAVACALAEQGWHSTLVDRCASPAQQGSGNPAGLFHGIVNPQDGSHARFNRAAALQAQGAVRQAIGEHGAQGDTRGLLRLEMRGKDTLRMRAELAALQLPADYAQALDAAEASARCGLRLEHPAWFYPGGGWVQPGALARSFLQRAGRSSGFVGCRSVHALRQCHGRWSLLDAAGHTFAEATIVVLANAWDALRLLDVHHWPVQRVRGQISLYDNAGAAAAQRFQLPWLPLAGAGYVLPPLDGQALFGATSSVDDDGETRPADHAANLQRLRLLSPQSLPAGDSQDATCLHGRVGWRCVAADRLPMVGAVPDEAAWAQAPSDRLREAPRKAGLYLLSGLASRGISWATLGGQLLAAQISGAPLPLEASLVDAVDPARFALRAARRG